MTDTATLLIVDGPNRGQRLPVHADGDGLTIGRSIAAELRLDDSEVSRRHARLSRDPSGGFVLEDLRSRNGVFVNGIQVSDVHLNPGDTIRIGSTRLVFDTGESVREPAARYASSVIRILDDSASSPQSSIVQRLPLQEHTVAAWPDERAGLELLYRISEELVRPVSSDEELLDRILQPTVRFVHGDRGCVLMTEPVGSELTTLTACSRVRSGNQSSKGEMTVSRSIARYCLRNDQAVRTSDANLDDRFSGGESIAREGIREVMCAPLKGRDSTLGVIYLDTCGTAAESGITQVSSGVFTDQHLRTVAAVARQTALALEARRYQEALVRAERLAAMGQTTAILSHHIKNILQGLNGGGYLLKKGMQDNRTEMMRQGWSILERSHKRIEEIVSDMLSWSRDRVPLMQSGSVNTLCADVAETVAARAGEVGVQFEFDPDHDVPDAAFDPAGMHRAVLNIALNAVDAVEGRPDGAVVMQTAYDAKADMVLVAVTDNGPGIPEDQRQVIFNLFESSKGERGTGIGLPVSRKILREHGGRIRVESESGLGARFILAWPRGATEELQDRATRAE